MKIVIFAAMTGARLGEVMNLDWKDVNFTKRTVLIHSSISYTVKGGRMRSVPLNSTVYGMLMKEAIKEGLVFPGKRGGDANLNFVSASFRKVVRKARDRQKDSLPFTQTHVCEPIGQERRFALQGAVTFRPHYLKNYGNLCAP